MKNTTAAAGKPGFHHRQRRAEFDPAEAPTEVQREKGGGRSTSASASTSTSGVLDHGLAKKAADSTGLVERKPTEDINESAEAFINKFRQQLLLQRLESIENYEQMLRRGT